MASKHELTILAALRDHWYIEEIQQLTKITDVMKIHGIAKRNGLKAKHAPISPNFMRHKAIAEAAKSGGTKHAAEVFHLTEGRVRDVSRAFDRMDKERRVSK